jgi:hypothetical protein
LPVPILVENEHLQIWQLLTALLAFLELKRCHLRIVYVLNKQRKPRNILMRVCLLIFGCCHWVFLTIDARMGRFGVLLKGAFYKIPGLACRPTISSPGPARGLTKDLFMSLDDEVNYIVGQIEGKNLRYRGTIPFCLHIVP